MENKKENTAQEQYSSMVNGNTILLSLEGWIKYIEGFTKGLETTDKVNSAAVLDCIGEILEYMNGFKTKLLELFLYCENTLQENEELKIKLSEFNTQEEKLIEVEDNIQEKENENDRDL